MDKDQAAPFLVTLAYQHIRSSIARNAAPSSNAVYEFNMAAIAVERLLRERPPGWFRDYDEMLLRALIDALEEGRRIQGRDVRRWQYGAWLRVGIHNAVLHQVPIIPKVPPLWNSPPLMLDQLPFVGSYLNVGPVPMSGATTSIKQTTRALAPSMRMNADLGDWDRSLLNVTIGESGQILSSHYRDQWEAYYNARSFPMQFGRVQVKSTLEFRVSAR